MLFTHACRFESFIFLLFDELKKLCCLLLILCHLHVLFSDEKIENASTEKSSLMSE